MKYRPKIYWQNLAKNQNLLFFVQLVDELLDDYSIPSHRISTLNAHTLCLDADDTLRDIEKNKASKYLLQPVIEEIVNEIEKDISFKIFHEKQAIRSAKEKLQTKQTNPEILRKVLQDIISDYFIPASSYLTLLATKIYEIIVANNESDQGLLTRLTKSFVSELLLQPFNEDFILECLEQVFFTGSQIENSSETLDRFFNMFIPTPKQHLIVFKADKKLSLIFNKHPDIISCTPHPIPLNGSPTEKEFQKLKPYQLYYTLRNENALDPYTAIQFGIDQIRTLASYLQLSDHYTKFNLSNLEIGAYDKTKKLTIPRKKPNAIRKIKNHAAQYHSLAYDICFNSICCLAQQSIEEALFFQNALHYHSLALDTELEINQILTLFPVFESLLLNVKNNKKSQNHFEQIATPLIPILKRVYLEELFAQLGHDLWLADKTLTDEITANAPHELTRFLAWTILPEYEQPRQAILEKLNLYPLLRERIKYYNKHLSTPEGIYKFIEKHAKRVRWQLQRIYRCRNLIIHKGQGNPFLLHLFIENLHAYADAFLIYMVTQHSKKKSRLDILNEIPINDKLWETALTNQDTPFPLNETTLRNLLNSTALPVQ